MQYSFHIVVEILNRYAHLWSKYIIKINEKKRISDRMRGKSNIDYAKKNERKKERKKKYQVMILKNNSIFLLTY